MAGFPCTRKSSTERAVVRGNQGVLAFLLVESSERVHKETRSKPFCYKGDCSPCCSQHALLYSAPVSWMVESRCCNQRSPIMCALDRPTFQPCSNTVQNTRGAERTVPFPCGAVVRGKFFLFWACTFDPMSQLEQNHKEN